MPSDAWIIKRITLLAFALSQDEQCQREDLFECDDYIPDAYFGARVTNIKSILVPDAKCNAIASYPRDL